MLIPEVSVIVPAFRAESTIADAITDLQRQTLRNIEIVVVDDASPDETAAIVHSMATRDERISVLRMDRNRGPGCARNRGLAHARGRWIALLDADDRCLPDRLARLTAIGARQDADMVADNLLLLGADMPADARLLDAATLEAGCWLDARRFIQGNMGSRDPRPRTFGFLKPLIRASFLRQHDLRYPAARFAEDFLFYLDCLLSGAQWLVVPDAFYCYRQRKGSLTHGHSADDLTILATAESALLRHPAVQADRLLAKALRRHRHSVELAAAWVRFATAVKLRAYARAGANLFRTPAECAHILREAVRAVPRVLMRK